jgi:hypothetical protein
MKAYELILLCLMFPALAFAHGDEDHDHDGAPEVQTAASGQPRIETASKTFEIVGRLQDGELSLLIDRFETNEPVLNGKLEVGLNGRKVAAKFHADHGDYAVDDGAFIEALAKPGKHPLVFTVSAANETDLLEGTMQVADAAQTESETPVSRIPLAAAAIVGTVLTLVLAALARRKSATGKQA